VVVRTITEISIRGTNQITLLLRDGARLNQIHLAAISLPFIDTTDIKQIEVLKVQHLYNMVQMQLVV
jgi:outer membrane receptor protein involved in Fe transport